MSGATTASVLESVKFRSHQQRAKRSLERSLSDPNGPRRARSAMHSRRPAGAASEGSGAISPTSPQHGMPLGSTHRTVAAEPQRRPQVRVPAPARVIAMAVCGIERGAMRGRRRCGAGQQTWQWRRRPSQPLTASGSGHARRWARTRGQPHCTDCATSPSSAARRAGTAAGHPSNRPVEPWDQATV